MNQKTVKELIHQIEKAADAIGSTYCRLNDTLDAFYAILADAGSSVQSVQSVKRGNFRMNQRPAEKRENK